MARLNKFVCIANLVTDPELRVTQSGKNMVTVRVAINTRKNDNTVFIDLKAWDKTADFLSRNARKGSPVAIVGEIAVDNYTDKQGQKQSRLYINAQEVEMILPRGDDAARYEAPANTPSAPAFDEISDDADLPF